MGTGERLGVTCDGLASCSGEYKYPKSFKAKDSRYKHRLD